MMPHTKNKLKGICLSPFLTLLLGGCCAVTSRQGLLMRNDSNVPAYAYSIDHPSDYSNSIGFENLPISISLGHLPDERLLSFGPGIILPLPIIPWPPGIAYRLFSNKAKDLSMDKLQVILTFEESPYHRRQKGAVNYYLDPKKVAVSIGEHTIYPSSYTCILHDVHYAQNGSGRWIETDTSVADHNGIFKIAVDAVQSMDLKTIITLTFDVYYADINEATLEIRDLYADSKKITIPKTALQNRRHVFFGWLSGIGP